MMNYVDYLKEQIKRLELVEKYGQKAEKATKEKTKNYYLEGMRYLFAQGENFDNYEQIFQEYRDALVLRNDVINQLYQEIKMIKKLRI